VYSEPVTDMEGKDVPLSKSAIELIS